MKFNVGKEDPATGKLSARTVDYLLLLYWPIHCVLYRLSQTIFDSYYPMHCALDDLIPFCEWFYIPYVSWYFFLAGMAAYTLFRHRQAFRSMIYSIILTHLVSLAVLFLFPNGAPIRPEVFPRDNLLTRLVGLIYAIDPPTNACPSLHVVGSVVVMQVALYTDAIRSRLAKVSISVWAIIICLSTMFIKQHSVLDVLGAVPVCLLCHFTVFSKKQRRKFYGNRVRSIQPESGGEGEGEPSCRSETAPAERSKVH